MKAIELIGSVDEEHQLRTDIPPELPEGQVRLIVLLPDEDDASAARLSGVAQAWSAELTDRRADIYTMQDGQPIDPAK